MSKLPERVLISARLPSLARIHLLVFREVLAHRSLHVSAATLMGKRGMGGQYGRLKTKASGQIDTMAEFDGKYEFPRRIMPVLNGCLSRAKA